MKGSPRRVYARKRLRLPSSRTSTTKCQTGLSSRTVGNDYVKLSDEHLATNDSRKDFKFSQIARNLKSHKASKSNFIFQGYAEEVRGGFKITDKGIEFVWSYFKD
ncbi:MAG: hypothetical protein ACKOPO_01790 [Novosphingobium sp.]